MHPCLTDIVSICMGGISYSFWLKIPRPSNGTLLYHRRHNATYHGTGMEINLNGINVVVESFTEDQYYKVEVCLCEFRIVKRQKARMI